MISYSIHSQKRNSTHIKTYPHITHHLPLLPLLPFLSFLSGIYSSSRHCTTHSPRLVSEKDEKPTSSRRTRYDILIAYISLSSPLFSFSILLASLLFLLVPPSLPISVPFYLLLSISLLFTHNLHVLFPIPCSLVSRKGNGERTRGRIKRRPLPQRGEGKAVSGVSPNRVCSRH